jgi:thiamine biosynthesis protein ThiI
MIIIRYAEIGLKGKNRRFFENTLIKNIKASIAKKYKIIKLRNRILINTNDKLDLSDIYGVSSFSYANEFDLDIEKLNKKALAFIKSNKSFRITCQRLDKSIPLKSIDIEKKIGEYVFKNSKSKVKLKNPDINIQIELFNKKAYIFTKKIKGPGGLPVGVEGNVIVLIENKDSIKAAHLIMKRGCDIIPVAFKKINIKELNKKITIIKDLKETESIAKQHNAKALVIGQKLENFKEINTKLLVLRPLIAE